MLRALTKEDDTENKAGSTNKDAEREDDDISYSTDTIDPLAFTPVFETEILIPPDIPLTPDNETNSLTSGSQSNKRIRHDTPEMDTNRQRPRTDSANTVDKSSLSEEAMTL